MVRRQAYPWDGTPAGMPPDGPPAGMPLDGNTSSASNRHRTIGETGKSMRPSRKDQSMPRSGEADLVRFAPRDADSPEGICGQFGRNSQCAELRKLRACRTDRYSRKAVDPPQIRWKAKFSSRNPGWPADRHAPGWFLGRLAPGWFAGRHATGWPVGRHAPDGTPAGLPMGWYAGRLAPG